MEKPQPLNSQVVGLSWLFIGVALTLVESGKLKVKDLVAMLRAVYAYVAITQSPEVARPVAHAMTAIAGFESFGKDVRQSLLLSVGLHLRERPEHRAALGTWLSFATPEEIEEDLAQWLRELLGTKSPRATDE